MSARSKSADRASMRHAKVLPGNSTKQNSETTAAQEKEDALNEALQSTTTFARFLKYPLPNYPTVTYEATITREWLPGSSRFSLPVYRMYLELLDKRLFLLSARMDPQRRCYRISVDHDHYSRSNEFAVGELRCSRFGTEFSCFSIHGKNKTIAADELLGIHYKTNVLGFNGPREMVLVLSATYDIQANKILPVDFIRGTGKDSLLARYHMHGCTKNSEGIVVCRNLRPRWNDTQRSYQLQFNNRIRQSSVKNFKMLHPTEDEQDLIQFGKSGLGTFSLDFSYPLTPLHAFAIALSSIHPKLACD